MSASNAAPSLHGAHQGEIVRMFEAAADGQALGDAGETAVFPAHFCGGRHHSEHAGHASQSGGLASIPLAESWFQSLFSRWLDEDKSLRNRQWIEGIVEAFQDGIAGKL